MKSLSDLANDYEHWAVQNEKFAAAITGYLPLYNPKIREQEADRARVLLHEAQAYRENASRFRSGPDRQSSQDCAGAISIEWPPELAAAQNL